MPFINLRLIGFTALIIVLLAVAGFGWLWYSGRPETLLKKAQDQYEKAEKLREAKDTAKAKAAYQTGQTAVEQFLTRVPPSDARASGAYMLRYKLLKPLAGIVKTEADKEDSADLRRQAAGLYEEAYRSGERAAALDNNNVEAQAAVLEDYFRRNDFNGAFPYARALIDNVDKIPADVAQREEMHADILGAYFVLALRDLREKHPDEALKELDKSRETEERWAASHPGSRQGIPRWRAAYLEAYALQDKADQLRGKGPGAGRPSADPAARREAQKTDERLHAQVQKYVDRARNEQKATIPASEGQPEKPMLATLSETNVNGLIDLLLLSLKTADGFAAVQDRADLLLDVCEKLGNSAAAPKHIYAAAVRGASQLRVENANLPADKRLKPDEMARLQERVVAVNDDVLKNGGDIDPSAFLEMSKVAQREKDGGPRALELAKKGLEVCHRQGLTSDKAIVVDLNAQAAWLLLMDHKVKDAEEYLNDIGKNQRLSPNVSYMRGLAAILDGRLEEGVKDLKDAQKSSVMKEKLPLLLGLAQAYMGMGQLENAMPVMEQLHDIYKKQQAKNRDDEPWMNTWLPTLQHVNVNLLKGHLQLATAATEPREAKAHYQKAMDAFNELKGTYVAEEAVSAMISYKLGQLKALEAQQPGSPEADEVRREITKILVDLPAGSREDPRLLWSQVNVILAQRVMDPATVAAALVAPLSAPTDVAVRAGEVGRLRAGYDFQLLKAEEFLMRAAAKQPDSMSMQLAWVRWLLNNNRTDEALAKLSDLENKAVKEEDRRRLQAFRAQLLLATGQSDQADKLITQLKATSKDELGYLDLWIEELLRTGDVKQAEDVMKKVLSKHDQSGLALFSQGRVRQAAGDYAQAIPAYERSMEFAQYKTGSQNGLLACVLAIANGPPGKPEKANPAEAFAEAKRLRKAHPTEPAILLAYAVTARTMDEIYGDGGMEGALADLIKLYRDQQSPAAFGASYTAAQQWVAAGRPDRARQELKAYPGHLPSLMLATQLAIADADWPEVATDLQRIKTMQPNLRDLPLWEALLQEAQGHLPEARKTYEQLVKDGWLVSAGYAGLARLHENAKEYKEALEAIKKWRKELPDDDAAAVALVRVLCRDGQAAEAVKEADAYVKARAEHQDKSGRDFDAKTPPKDKAEADARARVRADVLRAMTVMWNEQMEQALESGKAWAQAEKWLTERLQPAVEKLPEDNRKTAQLKLKVLLGGIYMEQGRQKKENSPERAKYMDLAMQQYDEIWKAFPGDLIAGNNLAWLLVQEKREGPRALALVEEVRKGKYSQKPRGAERLPVEFLDTIGVVYRLNGQNQEALNLFKEAMQRYADDPRVVMHLAQSQKALGLKVDAFTTFKKAIDLADARSKVTLDPDRKADLAHLIDEARAEQQKLNLIR